MAYNIDSANNQGKRERKFRIGLCRREKRRNGDTMKTIEYVTPNEMRATRKVIEKLTVDRETAVGDGNEECRKYFASMDELKNNYFWVFDLIDGFQYSSKVKGQNQIWKIESNPGAETMFFRCFVNGKAVVAQTVEWVVFPIKNLELYVIDGVIRLTKKAA
jgi:hypothetical protein